MAPRPAMATRVGDIFSPPGMPQLCSLLTALTRLLPPSQASVSEQSERRLDQHPSKAHIFRKLEGGANAQAMFRRGFRCVARAFGHRNGAEFSGQAAHHDHSIR